MKTPGRFYLLYNERAIDGDTEYATALDSSDDPDTFKPYDGSWGLRVCLYEYTITGVGDRGGMTLGSGHLIEVLEAP